MRIKDEGQKYSEVSFTMAVYCQQGITGKKTAGELPAEILLTNCSV